MGSRWYIRVTGTGGGGAGGKLLGDAALNLAVDATTTSQPPVYATLMTLGLTTILAASSLWIVFSANLRITGPSAANNSPNIRFRHNGVLITPGGGTTLNTERNKIEPIVFTRRLAVTAGLQTIDVEWAYFGPVGQTLDCSPVTLPDLMHAHLELQEIAP